MRSACFFWPGSEAEIDGGRPTYYLKFDDHFPDAKRIEQVVAWLRMPAEQRPHFITLYYSNVDHAGHQYGPDSPQTAAAVEHVDQLVGDLWAQLSQLQLPVDLFVVADHGMEKEQGPWIDLDKYADLTNFTDRRMAALSQLRSCGGEGLPGVEDQDGRLHRVPAQAGPGGIRVRLQSPRGRSRHRGQRAVCDSRPWSCERRAR